MRSAKLTIAKSLSVFFVALGLQSTTYAQENSPYSRYGLGDIVPNHNILSRGMGGVAAGIQDYKGYFQSLNFTNPASLASVEVTMFDISAESDSRTLKSTNPPAKYTQTNSLFSSFQLAFPLTTKKMIKKGNAWGLSFGLRPVTRIGYKIEKNERLTGIDSLHTIYEGDGGVNQAYLGTAVKIQNFSIGAIAGYMFGNKNYTTRLEFINDTTDYYKGIYSSKTNFGGFFVNAGVQYSYPMKNGTLCVGLYGGVRQKLKATRDDAKETFYYDANGQTFRLDSVYEQNGVKGTISYPSTVGIGFAYSGSNWMFGMDVETTNWSNYTYYGQTDAVKNNYTVRAGMQYYPAKIGMSVKKYFNFVKYRAGLYYGTDYVQSNASHPEYGVSVGAGFPLTSLQRLGYGSYDREFVLLNTAVEFGSRGNKQNNIRDNTLRFSIGIAMTARWFVKPKYN